MDSLGNRMKHNYENVFKYRLPRRIPAIIRVDMKCGHSITKLHYGKEWSPIFTNNMIDTAIALSEEFHSTLIYAQSDEISLLLTDYKTINTQPIFDYEINKLVSISASVASVAFTRSSGIDVVFDSRAFSIPKSEVANYYYWRQQDATRNAIQMAGQEKFSHKQLYGKSCNDIQEMLFSEYGVNFNDYPIIRKRGFCIINKELDVNIPIFSQDRDYIERHVYIRED